MLDVNVKTILTNRIWCVYQHIQKSLQKE